jgi:hypothetical protein
MKEAEHKFTRWSSEGNCQVCEEQVVLPSTEYGSTEVALLYLALKKGRFGRRLLASAPLMLRYLSISVTRHLISRCRVGALQQPD